MVGDFQRCKAFLAALGISMGLHGFLLLGGPDRFPHPKREVEKQRAFRVSLVRLQQPKRPPAATPSRSIPTIKPVKDIARMPPRQQETPRVPAELPRPVPAVSPRDLDPPKPAVVETPQAALAHVGKDVRDPVQPEQAFEPSELPEERTQQPASLSPSAEEPVDSKPLEESNPSQVAAIGKIDYGFREAKPVRTVKASYPRMALRMGREADVTLKIHISSDGSVTNADVVTGAGMGFDQAALDAIRRFHFMPARQNGEAVPSELTYVYRFRLRN